jgi:hypothetical protein
MGTADVGERELLQGLIKLAAAFVHGVRGNPSGVAKNLRGSLARIEAGTAAGAVVGIDAGALADAIRARLADLAAGRPHRAGVRADGRGEPDPIVIPLTPSGRRTTSTG